MQWTSTPRSAAAGDGQLRADELTLGVHLAAEAEQPGGAAAGAGLGAAVITVGGPAALHLGLNGAVCVAVLLGVRRLFLAEAPVDSASARGAADQSPAPSETSTPPAPAAQALPRRAAVAVLVPAVVIAMAGFGVEEFGNAWATLFLITERGLDPAAAVLGASTLLGAQFVGRLAGDRTLAALQDQTGGFREFVLLPFVHHNSPIYLAGVARPGPTNRENRAVHAVARLLLHGRGVDRGDLPADP